MSLWVLLGLALFALLVTATVWLIRNLSSGARPGGDSAEEKLRHRYATSELGPDEFRQRLADLRGE